MSISAAEPRKLRADAQRNRERLLEFARTAFARDGAEASLDDIARTAGVGSATLYRHYPTREALIQAVYLREVEKLGKLGEQFAASKRPMEALRDWMLVFVDHVIEKHILAAALNEADYANASVIIQATIRRIIQRAIENGDVRNDTNSLDLLRALIGVSHMATGLDWQESAHRVVDILLRGVSELRK